MPSIVYMLMQMCRRRQYCHSITQVHVFLDGPHLLIPRWSSKTFYILQVLLVALAPDRNFEACWYCFCNFVEVLFSSLGKRGYRKRNALYGKWGKKKTPARSWSFLKLHERNPLPLASVYYANQKLDRASTSVAQCSQSIWRRNDLRCKPGGQLSIFPPSYCC